jgi:phosphoglycerol transferase MdoB-like AlkP superfamily enzyme
MGKKLLKLILSGLLISPALAAAQGFGDMPYIEPPTWSNAPNVMEVLNRVADGLFAILLVVTAIAIILAAYYFVTAAGEPDKVKKARDFVIYALVGLLVAFLAKGLVYLVATIVGVPVGFWDIF